MKRILVPVLLAAFGLVVAGCGSAQKGGSASIVMITTESGSVVLDRPGPIIVSGTRTFANLKPGARVVCKGGQPGVRIPFGEGASPFAMVSHGPGMKLELSHAANGAYTVSCRPT